MAWVRHRGGPLIAYLALFAWSFAAATVLPLASEPMLIAMVRSSGDLIAPVLTATGGNYLGACTTYWLARMVVKRVLSDPPDKPVQTDEPSQSAPSRHHARATRLVARFGQPVLLLSWVPLLGDAIVAVAGGVGIGFLPFSGWVIAGKLARYAAVAVVAVRM